MADDKKYYAKRTGSSYSTTQASSSGVFRPKASDGWRGFKTADERRAWMEKDRKKRRP